ncbi:MAG: hypothetical protein JWP36_1946 [Paucimonas sp.]|nr:hypothetical protein [Paucimonas sp.]
MERYLSRLSALLLAGALVPTLCAAQSDANASFSNASPYGRATAGQDEAARQADQMRLNALAAWDQLPAAQKARLASQLATLDAAQRLELINSLPALKSLSDAEKQVLLAEIAVISPVPNSPPVAVITTATSATFVGWTALSPGNCQPAWDATFSGAQSTDPDGQVVSYHWNWATGPGFPTGEATSTDPSQVLRVIGSHFLYTVTLTVTDNSGATNATTVNYTTPRREEQPPTTC